MIHGKALFEQLQAAGYTCAETGSYTIGGYVEDTSDYDIVVLHNCSFSVDPVEFLNNRHGYFLGYSGSAAHDPMTVSWKGWFNGEVINVITILDEDLYKAWITATEVTKGLNVHHKPTRLAFFEHYKGIANKKVDNPCADVSIPF